MRGATYVPLPRPREHVGHLSPVPLKASPLTKFVFQPIPHRQGHFICSSGCPFARGLPHATKATSTRVDRAHDIPHITGDCPRDANWLAASRGREEHHGLDHCGHRTTEDQSADQTAIRPFQLDVPEAELTDLRRRINATRWPERETVTDASQGVQLATTQALARYWATDYDWRKCEARLNALPQFITEIDGLDIHFIHVRSKHENALPLIVTHGWPGSIIEQMKIIEPLTNPTAHGASASDAFHVVIPSMPGYGFSGRPTTHRLGPGPHRARLDRADEAPWIHEIRGARWRLGRDHHRADGRAGAAGIAGHSHQHGQRDSTRHRQGWPFPARRRRRISQPTRSSRTSG